MNIKKIIAIILCFTFVANSIVLVFAASDEVVISESVDNKYKNVVGLLSNLNISADIDGFSQSTRFVKRYEFAVLLTRVLNIDVSGYIPTTVIADVDDLYLPYVAYVCDNGYMKVNEGVFDPNEYVTLADVTRSLVKALGYDAKAEAMNRASAYFDVAKQLKLFDGVVTYKNDNRIQFKSLANMIYNTLFTNVLEIRSIGALIEYGEGDMFITNVFDVYETEGRVNANAISSIEGGTTTAENVRIDKNLYNVGQTDISMYLGYYVKAYYKDEQGGKNTIVYFDFNNDCDILVLDAAEISYEHLTYTYENEKNKEKDAKLSNSAVIIYNGSVMYYDEEYMCPETGRVTLVDYNSDKKYDTVIIDSATVGIITSYNTFSKKLDYKCNENGRLVEKTINLSDYDDNVRYLNLSGRALELSALKEGIVISLFDNVSGFGQNSEPALTIYQETNSVIGVLQSMSTSGTKKGKINDVEYEISNSYVDKSGVIPEIGADGTFYFDRYGRIVSYKPANNDWNIGYLIAVKEVGSGLSPQCRVRMLVSEGNVGAVKDFDIAENSLLDGVKCKKNGRAKVSNEPLFLNLNAKPQPVRYKTDVNGCIKNMDTGENAVRIDDDLRVLYPSSGFANLKYRNYTFGLLTGIKDTATVFVVPSATDDVDDYNLYRSLKSGYFVTDLFYNIRAYALSEEDLAADVLVVKRNDFIAGNKPVGIVTKITRAVNDEGEIVEKMTVKVGDKSTVYISQSEDYFTSQGVNVNDLVRVYVVNDNIVSYVELVYDYDEDKIKINNTLESKPITAVDIPITEFKSGFIKLETGNILSLNGATVSVYDLSNENRPQYSVGSFADITTESDGSGYKVIVTTSYMQVKSVFVYKY